MKVNVEVTCTPEEARSFFGLPDLKPMQDRVMGEIEERLREQLERILARMDLVTREEFEAAKSVASNARAEQELLLERIAALEERLTLVETRQPPTFAVSRPAGLPPGSGGS